MSEGPRQHGESRGAPPKPGCSGGAGCGQPQTPSAAALPGLVGKAQLETGAKGMCQALMCRSFTISTWSLNSAQAGELADRCAGVHRAVPV